MRVYIVWGVRNEGTFDLSAEDTQLSILSACRAFQTPATLPPSMSHNSKRLQNPDGTLTLQEIKQLNVRGVASCFMSDFASWAKALRIPFPVPRAEFSTRFASWLRTRRGIGYIRNGYIKVDDGETVTAVRIVVQTGINIESGAATGHRYYDMWESFVADRAPDAIQTSSTWARVETEIATVDGALYAWSSRMDVRLLRFSHSRAQR